MLRPTVSVSGIKEAFDGSERAFAGIVTDAMRGATGGLKQTLRSQVTSAGLGARLANTWRGEVYPESGDALNPAGYVWSNAPAIIDAFARGATIAPLGGKHYLWVPTKSVPRAAAQGRASSTKRMTPEQLLASFGLSEFLIRKGRGGRLLAFIVEGRGTTKLGRVRAPRRGRLAHGADGQLVLMYTLTPTVKLPQELDLDGAADAGASDFVNRTEQGAR